MIGLCPVFRGKEWTRRHAIGPPASPHPAISMKVMILGAGDKPQVQEAVESISKRIATEDEVVLCDLSFSQDLSQAEADLAVVLGGDGSILRAARQMGYRQRPVLGVNLGKMGFLASLSPQDLEDEWSSIREGNYRTKDCLMLECEVRRGKDVIASQLALNEVTVQTGSFGLLDIQLYVDSERVTTYSCDGLIVSTPIGSTAHNLSAGGPILRQNLQALVISPISPHTLTMRPVVDAADHVYELVVPQPTEGTAAVVDGQILARLQPGDCVRVVKAPACFQMVIVSGHSYYRTLRQKLGWSGRPNYQGDDPHRDD